MTKIYEKFPEITEVKAKVLSKKFVNNNTYLILDKTIFMPKNDTLIDEPGHIGGCKLLSVEKKKDNIIHLVEGRENRTNLLLSLDKDIRFHNLYYATSFSLFKIFYNSYYRADRISFKLYEDYGEIKITRPSRDFDPRLIEELVNYAIDKGLSLNLDKGIVELKSIGKTINNLISFDNTYKIKSFEIIECLVEENNTLISFKAGK
ncbi:hypothetical protein [Anaerococcus sp.]|uniref:hypothetical protein n=1 Tax=Anaerococcus sp. TaxID=1872515 RepID=UPI0027BA8592|nr:hypothetical protein [Anaerococcus sp.]